MSAGYFPEGSMLRRVQGERAVGLLYGQRALAIGAISPVNFIGTALHTRHPDKPFARLTTTARMFETIFFGTREEADRVLAAVHRMHEGVRGTLPEDAGPVPAGTPYSAFDPEAMLWTIAVAAESAKTFYELLVRRLTAAERDSFWADWVRFGELFGMPREAAPGSWSALRTWYEARLASEQAYLSEEARWVGLSILFHIPVPASQQPAMLVHNLLMIGALPPRVRELYGLRYTPAQQAAFAAAVRSLRACTPVVPAPLRTGPNTSHFRRVAATERARIARGARVWGALASPGQ